MTHTIIKSKHINDIAIPNNHNNEQQELRKCIKFPREDTRVS